jgi:hypothetical protein
VSLTYRQTQWWTKGTFFPIVLYGNQTRITSQQIPDSRQITGFGGIQKGSALRGIN